jgi:hypothetical protein
MYSPKIGIMVFKKIAHFGFCVKMNIWYRSYKYSTTINDQKYCISKYVHKYLSAFLLMDNITLKINQYTFNEFF